jgi:7-cyano-7-deazaguanine synthase
MAKAVVLLSGGLDSTVCFSLAHRDFDEVMGVTISYGQRHPREIRAAEAVCKHYDSPWKMVALPYLYPPGASKLTDKSAEMPQVPYSEIEGVSPLYVPFRNAFMLSVATIQAEIHNASAVYFGAHSEDAHNWAYPDCTPEFIGGMANAIYIGTYHRVRLMTPLQWLVKAAVVAEGFEVGTPFHLTWSCYAGGDKACGKCPTCQSRLEAFALYGDKDPIEYEAN